MSHDYAVMRLYEPLGTQLGYLGYVAPFDDDWRNLDVWFNVAYHRDFSSFERPAWQRYAIEDDYEDDDGQLLETEASLEHGSSGSPFFSWFTDGHVYVVGVVGGGNVLQRGHRQPPRGWGQHGRSDRMGKGELAVTLAVPTDLPPA